MCARFFALHEKMRNFVYPPCGSVRIHGNGCPNEGSKCRWHRASADLRCVAVARMHRMILRFSHDLCNCVYHYNHFYVKIYINFAISLGVAVALPSAVHYLFSVGKASLVVLVYCYRVCLFIEAVAICLLILFPLQLMFIQRNSALLIFVRCDSCVVCAEQTHRVSTYARCRRLFIPVLRACMFPCTFRRLSSWYTVSFHRVKKKNAIFVSIWKI